MTLGGDGGGVISRSVVAGGRRCSFSVQCVALGDAPCTEDARCTENGLTNGH